MMSATLHIKFISFHIVIIALMQQMCCAPVDRENATTVFVNIPSLPEPFDGSKLPNTNRPQNGCLQFLDCIEKVPRFKKPEDPLKLETEFMIHRNQDEQIVPYQPTVNCLEDNQKECGFYPFDLNQLQKSRYDPSLPTIVIIAGYKSGKFEKWQMRIKELWNQLSSANIIIVSWSGGNQGLYEFAAANTKVVARQTVVLLYYLARFYDFQLTDEGFTENIHIVGHSLGAHIAGYIGQDFSGKIGRITGLDPAGPLFVDLDRQYTLDKTDAIFVDVIHTNAGNVNNVIDLAHNPSFGMERPIGHVDYYANDGRRQPGCNGLTEFTGCSHNLAHEYYSAFLEHEIHIRDDIKREAKGDYHDCHRLFAYKSDSFEDFRAGISMSKNCPNATLNDHDLYSKDLDQCTIPVDFVTPFKKLRQELEKVYNLDLNPSSETKNKYYFYTRKSIPYLNNHILIRVRVHKDEQSKQEPKVCDVAVEIKMAGGMQTKVKLPGYQLLDEQDHYEVLLPFLSPMVYSKYELARLDADNYYIEQTNKLLEKVPRIFPKSIDVQGLLVGTPEKGGGFFSAVQDFFGFVSSNEQKVKERHECSLNVDAVSVRPIKRLHRHFAATYTIQAMDKDRPDLWLLYDENSSFPNNEIAHFSRSDEIKGKYDGATLNSRVFIDSVILGPFDESLDPPVDETVGLDGSVLDTEDPHEIPTSSDVDCKIWLCLTVMTILLTMIFVAIMMYKSLTNARQIHRDEDKLKLVQ